MTVTTVAPVADRLALADPGTLIVSVDAYEEGGEISATLTVDMSAVIYDMPLTDEQRGAILAAFPLGRHSGYGPFDRRVKRELDAALLAAVNPAVLRQIWDAVTAAFAAAVTSGRAEWNGTDAPLVRVPMPLAGD